jgi:hypothetical protein
MTGKQTHRREHLRQRLAAEHLAALPARHALSPLVDPSLTGGLLGYAGGGVPTTPDTGTTTPTGTTPPTTVDPTGAPPSASVPTESINSAVSAAQSAAANGDGATAQNVDSPNSSAYASTVR